MACTAVGTQQNQRAAGSKHAARALAFVAQPGCVLIRVSLSFNLSVIWGRNQVGLVPQSVHVCRSRSLPQLAYLQLYKMDASSLGDCIPHCYKSAVCILIC